MSAIEKSVIVEVPSDELAVLKELMAPRPTGFTESQILDLDSRLKETNGISWRFAPSDGDTIDRYITAEFDDGMMMDMWFWAMQGSMSGTYGGIKFGDRDTLLFDAGECSIDSYEIDQEHTCVEGVYKFMHNGVVYAASIVAKPKEG